MEVPKSCLNASINVFYPFGYLEEGKVRGIFYNFVKDLSKRFDFCYEVFLSKVTDWGYSVNGSYSGVLNRTVHGEFDVNLDLRTISFSPDFVTSRTVVIVESSALAPYPTIQPNLFGFIDTFQYMVWAAIGITFLLVSLNFIGFSKVLRILENQFRDHESAVLTSIKIFLNQSFGVKALAVSYRILCGSVLLFALIVTLSYKCNMKANLILPKYNVPFKNLEELVNQKQYDWVITAGVMFGKVAKSAEKGTALRKLGDGINFDESLTSQEEVLAVAEEGKKVYMVVKRAVKTYIQKLFIKHKRCISTIMQETFMHRPVTWVYYKKSPWIKILEFSIMAYIESGIFNYEEKRLFKYVKQCTTFSKSGSMRPLSMKDFYGVFMLLIGGMFLGLVAFVMEKKI